MKRVLGIFTVALLSVTGAFAQAPAAPPAAGPDTVLLWHLDEGTGESAADASPAGRLAGKITGARWCDGRFGKALEWGEENGTVQVNGDLSAIKDAFTLQAWIRLDRLPTGKMPFWASDVVGRLGSFTLTVRPPGLLYVGVHLGSQTNWLTGQAPIPTGEWTHVALVYDGPPGKIGSFINRKIDTEFDLPPGSPREVNPSKNAFWIRSYGGGDEKLVGAMDEVCLSARAETFGHRWQSQVYLHALRYQSAFLLGATLQAGAGGKARALAVKITDGAGKSVGEKRLTPAEAEAGAVIPAPRLPAGELHAVGTHTAPDGSTQTLLDRKLRYTPPRREVVDFTPDGACLVKGKPFFPMGLYHVAQKDLKRVADAGFNLALAFAATFPASEPRKGDGVGYIERCGESGVLGAGLGGHLHAPKYGEPILTHYRGNPNLLFWYVADEPGGPGSMPEDLQRMYEQWCAWDATHPMFLLQNKPAEFLRYAPACDVFATDPYPISRDDNPALEHVVRYTEGAVRAVFGRKPVWAALQSYTTRAVSEGAKPRDLLPRLATPEELRCMSYLALAAGARGIIYYAFDDTYFNNGDIRGVHLADEFPEFWQALCRVGAELSAKKEVWTAPYASLRPENQTPKVTVQARPYLVGGKVHLLAVNPTRENQSVRIRLPGVRAGRAEDALGGASAPLAAGVLTDTLAPRAVKCYVVPGR